MCLSFILSVGLFFAVVSARSISPSEREAIWNNFKYRNAFVRWTMSSPNSTGAVIQGDDKNYQDPVFLIEVTRHNMLTVILPRHDGNTDLFSAQIPTADYPFEIILTIGQSLLVATSKCQMVMLDKMKDVDFKITTPEITLGSLPYFYENIHVSSGNPLPAFCSVLQKQEVATIKETVENKRRQAVETNRSKEQNSTCRFMDTKYSVGSVIEKSECETCTCKESGNFDCEHRGCVPLANCSYPLHGPGTCCPTRCANECEFNGVSHHHGSIFWPETCIRCECRDGSVHCKFNKAHMCPELPCPPEQQRKEIGQCCPSCVNFDYCSVNPCHPDATCSSSDGEAKCHCKEGFFGNGTFCYDIDECNFAWSIQQQADSNEVPSGKVEEAEGCRQPESGDGAVAGHKLKNLNLGGCTGSVCINTKGSFRCDCLPGHPRIDERTCLNLIRI